MYKCSCVILLDMDCVIMHFELITHTQLTTEYVNHVTVCIPLHWAASCYLGLPVLGYGAAKLTDI